MKKYIALILTFMLLTTGCSVTTEVSVDKSKNKDWELITDSAKGTDVVMYYSIEDDEFKTWMEKSIVEGIKSEYDINLMLTYKPLEEYYEDLKSEKVSELKGKFDMMIFEDSSFAKLKSNGLLYGPFSDKLPNKESYQGNEDYEILYAEGLSADDSLVLLGRKQLVCIYDEDTIDEYPATLDSLITTLDGVKGKFTYVDPKSQLGRDFINSVFFAYMDYEDVYSLNPDKAKLKEMASEALEFFAKLQPYMEMYDGKLPTNQDQIDEMFYNGRVIMAMSYDITHASTLSKKELYPYGAKEFIFDTGTTGDSFYGAIPFNAENKAGAIVALNYMLNIEAQAYKYDPKKWGNLPSLYTPKIEATLAKPITGMSSKRSDLNQEEILSKRIPEVPKHISDLLYTIWKEEVESKLYSN